MNSKTLSYVFIILICIGLADSLYLAMTTFLGLAPTCGVLHGCETVTRSVYSKLFGIPLSYLAAAYYLFGAFLAGFIVESKYARILALLFGTAGVIMGIWSVYVQAVLLHAYCPYCLGLDATALGICIVSYLMVRTQFISQK